MAVATGLLTRGQLRSPRFRRLFPDVYAPADLELDLALRARAAGLLVAGRGAVAGYAAAEWWGASCAPPDEPAHVLMTHRATAATRLRVHRDYFDFVETVPISSGGVVTTPERTAYDLARWAPRLAERVVAVDALAHTAASTSTPSVLCGIATSAATAARTSQRTLRLSRSASESPMESRVRVRAASSAGCRPRSSTRWCCAGAVSAGPGLPASSGSPSSTTARTTAASPSPAATWSGEAALAAAGWRVLRFDADDAVPRVRLAPPSGPIGACRARAAAVVACSTGSSSRSTSSAAALRHARPAL